MKTRNIGVLAGAAVAISGFGSVTAESAVDARQISETLIVVGTRQAYRGQFDALETPAANLVIDAEVLDRAGARNLVEALDLSASVARQNNFGGLWNSFAVRGFVGDQNLPSGYLVNGFNAGRGFSGPRDLSGIESVEVLKGPRAALFGRGEPGGTVNLVTKRPTFDTDGSLRLAAGSFDTIRFDADWTSPLTDALAVRLVGFHEDAGSFRDTVESERYGASPSIAWRHGDTTVVYELEWAQQEIPFDRGVVAIDGRLGDVPRRRFLGEPADGPMEAEVVGHQLELQHDFNSDWNVLVGVGNRDTSLEGFASEAELTGSRQLLFVDGRTLTRQRRFRDYDAEHSVVRGEISGQFATGNISHRILLGADYDEFENDQVFLRYRAPTLGSGPSLQQLYAIDVFEPRYGQFPPPNVGPLTDRVETQEATGAYLQDQFDLGSRTQLRVGVRYDDFRQRLDDRASGTIRRQSGSRWSPQFGLVIAATDNLAWYASYGEGFRPLSGADFAGNPFSPNKSTAAELGVKFELADGRLGGTASVFQIDQDNMLTADPINAGFSVAAGKARSRGFDLDVAGRIADGLDIWFSYAYVDAEMRNDVLDFDFAQPIAAGDRLLNVPRHSASLQVAHTLALVERPLTVGGGAHYVGKRPGAVASDFQLPDYTLVRLFANYRVTDSIRLSAEVDNLFNETWYSNSYNELWIQPGAPRSLRVSATLNF